MDTQHAMRNMVHIESPLHPTLSWRRRLRAFWRDYQWPVILGLGFIALVLGYIGFAKHVAARGESLSPLDLFYLTLQLIPMNSGAVSGSVSWELEVARLLIPAVAVYTAVKALAMIFREQVQLIRLWFIRDHIVICGLGRKGFLLTDHFCERGERVVVIEQDEGNDLRESCRERGAIVLVGDATDIDLLHKAVVHRAKFLISVCGDDGANAEVAVRAQKLTGDRKRGVLTCVIHIVDPQLCDLLREREIGAEKVSTFRLELFNVFDRGARILWREYPAFSETVEARSRPPHLLVIGLGGMGESLVVQAARDWRDMHGSAGQRLRITVIDREADWKAESLSVRYPQLAKVCELLPCQMDVRSPEFQRAEFLYDAQGRCDVDMVYICLDDDSLGLQTGLTLLYRMRESVIPIVVRMVEDAGLATLLRGGDDSKSTFANLHAFGLLDRTCTADLVLGGTHEVLARAIHEEYVRHQEQLGEAPQTNPVMVLWNNLPERLKESNRRQVDHIRVKIEAIRCGIAPLTDWDAASFEFTSDEVELMARMEHERWCEELRLDGWTYAAGSKDPDARTNPDLVSWEVLPDLEKEKNRITVRELPGFLARAGFQVYRLREG